MTEFPKELIERCAAAVRSRSGRSYEQDVIDVLRESGYTELVAALKMVDAWGHGLRHHTEHENKIVKAARVALKKAGAQ